MRPGRSSFPDHSSTSRARPESRHRPRRGPRCAEQWVLANYAGDYAQVRPEWSKGWGYSDTAAWADPGVLDTIVPTAYRTGLETGNTWDTAVSALDRHDPHRVFANGFLAGLLHE
ncbi:cholesterol oxidase substrate-binding domain-containing protein [Nocardia sp. NPDC003693]